MERRLIGIATGEIKSALLVGEERVTSARSTPAKNNSSRRKAIQLSLPSLRPNPIPNFYLISWREASRLLFT